MSEASVIRISAEAPSRWLEAWQFAKQELIHILWALMEMAILAPLALTVLPWARYWPTLLITLWILLLMLVPFNLVRLMGAMELRRSQQRNIMALVLVGVLFLSWRLLLFAPGGLTDLSWLGELFGGLGNSEETVWLQTIAVFAITLVAWWRGLRLVRIQPGIDSIGLRLRSGALAFFLFGLIASVTDPRWSLLPFILLYYLTGLMIVALLRAEQVQKESSGESASLRPTWLLAIFLTALMVVMVAGALALGISGDTASQLAAFFAPVWQAAGLMLAVVLAVLGYLGRPAIWLLALIIDTLGLLAQNIGIAFSNMLEETGVEIPNMDSVTAPVSEEGVVELAAPPQFNMQLLTILLMVAAVLIVVLALTRLYREVSFSDEEGQTVTGLGRGQLSRPSFGKRILNRLAGLRGWRTAASIRRIYLQMCNSASGAGFPRGETETPYEYLPRLMEIWPENQAEAELITRAYVRVRYGELPETREELDAIKEAWRTLESVRPMVVDSAENTPNLP